jgi:hypothetical protein
MPSTNWGHWILLRTTVGVLSMIEFSHPVALQEIAPELKLGRRLLPCAWLGRWDANDPIRKARASPELKSARLLAAYQYRVAALLLSDWGRSVPPPTVRWRQWTPKLSPQHVSISVARLEVPSLDEQKVRLMPLTGALIDSLPLALVLSALEWAPPVVAPSDSDGRFRVVANVIPALVASRLAPRHMVRVRVVIGRKPYRRTLSEILNATASRLQGFYEAGREQVVLDADSLVQAVALTGYSTAWCSRLRTRD